MHIAHHRHVVAATAAASLALAGVQAGTHPASATEQSTASSDTTTLAGLAENYLQQRADMLTTSSPKAKTALVHVRVTRSMATQTQDDLAALRDKGKRYKEVDGGYTEAQVDVKVDETTVDNGTATLKLTERTRLRLPFTPQEVEDGAPEYEELSLPHTVKFAQDPNGTWLLASDKADAEGGPTPTTQVGDADAGAGTDDGGGTPDEDESPKNDASDTTPLPDSGTSDSVKPGVSAAYGYNKMVAYADRYWDHHNDAYRTYGNDCTNFISQAMLAGGWGPKGGRPYPADKQQVLVLRSSEGLHQLHLGRCRELVLVREEAREEDQDSGQRVAAGQVGRAPGGLDPQQQHRPLDDRHEEIPGNAVPDVPHRRHPQQKPEQAVVGPPSCPVVRTPHLTKLPHHRRSR
ncbi:amidase domain-containing protein [Streptomyces sp. NBC_00647]